MTRSAAAFFATWLVLLVGCTTAEQIESSESGIAYHPDSDARREHARQEPTREYVREEPAAAEVPVAKRSDGLHWTERAYPTGDRRTSTVLLESGTPGEVSVGVPYEYVLKVTNISSMNLENVVVLDKPRGNFELRGSEPKTVDGRDLRWDLGSLRPSQAKEIHVSGAAVGEGQVIHCAEVDWSSLFCSTTQVVKPGLAISMTATAATLMCDPITYNVTVANNGTGVTSNVVIEDRLPDGVLTLDGKNSVRFSVPTLAPGESKVLSWKAMAKQTGRFGSAATAKADGNLTATSGEVSTTVTRPVLVLERKQAAQIYMGRTIAYDLLVRNTGDGEARDVVVTGEVPATAKFLDASDGAVMEGNVIRWKFGTMAPGTTKAFKARVSVASAGKVRAGVTATAYCAETVSAAGETLVTGVPAVLLEVVDLNDPVEVGNATTYVITATNQGTAPATNLKIVVNLEDTMAYVSATGTTKTDDTGHTVAFKPLASLAPGEKATWKVEVKAVREGDVRIKVAMTSDQLTRPVEKTEASNFYK